MTDVALRPANLNQRIWLHLGSRLAWNKELFFVGFVIYALTSVSFDALRDANFQYTWPLIWIDTFALMVCAIAILVWLLPKRLWSNTGAGLAINLSIVGVLGAAKNTATYLWAAAWGLESQPFDPVLGLAGGALMGIAVFMLGGALLASRVGHREEMQLLMARQQELLELETEVVGVARATQDALLKEARKSLLPQLAKFRAELGGQTEAATLSASLQTLVEKYVRPLSKNLNMVAENVVYQHTPKPRTVAPWRLPHKFEIGRSVRPMGILLIIAPAQIFTFRGAPIPPSLAEQLTGLGITLLCLFIVRELWPKSLKPSGGFGAATLVFISLVATFPQIAYLDAILPMQPYRAFTMSTIGVINFFTTANLMWMNVMDFSRVRLRQEVRHVNEKIKHELAIFDQRVWLQKRRWSYLLHGSVQAKLTAASMRVQQLPGKSKKLQSQAIAEVGTLIREIEAAVEGASVENVDLKQELSSLTSTWQGVMDIQVDISPPAWRVLESDQNAAMAVNEICREATTNAVMHGNASRMQVEISKPSNASLRLRFSNNGSYPKVKDKGLGLQMMDALTSQWEFSRDHTNGQVLMTAELPVSLE